MGQAPSCQNPILDVSPPEPLKRGGGRRLRGRDAKEKDDEGDELDLTERLPDECLGYVFGRLGVGDRNCCSLVCKRWNLVESRSRQRLSLCARSDLSPILSSLLLRRFHSVSVLSLRCPRKHLPSIDDSALLSIARSLPLLRKLKLKGCNALTDDGLLSFSLNLLNSSPSSPPLAKLSLASCGFGARGIASVVSNCGLLRDLSLKRLRKLDAQNVPIEIIHSNHHQRKHLDHGGGISKLERVCLKDMHNPKILIPLLRSSNNLKTLVVCRSTSLGWDTTLGSLPPSLLELQLDGVLVGDAGLSAVSSACPHLDVLYLGRVSHCTDAGLSTLASSCRKLRKLHVEALSRFSGGLTIGDAAVLSVAARCPLLQELVLMGIPVTVRSLSLLASCCPSLERVALCDSDSVGDHELELIATKFAALRKLCIKNCPVSDYGMDAISVGCPNLVKLKIKRCREVTLASVCRMRLQRKSLVVSVDAAPLLSDGDDDDDDDALPAITGVGVTAAVGGSMGNGGNRRQHSHGWMGTTNVATDVVCGSRGASLLRAKLSSALQLRKPS
ncbi:F-box protein SKIP2 [Acorus gramineus]|uniref:F-box protein SKIP2 n=1 Tax=Acorus gramineus TaxID=55184 RepID=A0AAV9AUR8_ACOGR|nr:F-box protein SKIP2 [Acorus gramineus]